MLSARIFASLRQAESHPDVRHRGFVCTSGSRGCGPKRLAQQSKGGIAAMRALSDVASMTGKEPIPQASGECVPSGLSPNACRFCSVKVQGCYSPHSTHKVSAIRPETSSKKTMAQQGDRAGGHGWPSKPLHPATCCLGTAATGCAPRRRTRLEQGIDSLYHAILSLWLLHLTSYGPAIKQIQPRRSTTNITQRPNAL